MKILFLTDGLARGGSQRRMIELIKNLSQKPENKVMLISLTEQVEYDTVYTLPIDFRILKRKFKKDPTVFFTLFGIIKSERPDVIHSWSSMANIYTLPIAKMLNIRFLTSVIADAPKGLTYRNKAYLRAKLVFPFADRITSNSIAGLKAYKAPMKKSICIYNGFDGKRLSALEDAAALKQTLGVEGRTVIGMVAGFENRKDYETLIKAAEIVVHQEPNSVFLFIGDGYTKAAMMKLVPANVKENIRFLGMISNVESYINIFDIGVLCTNSNVHQEGISNSIMEYMALQKPVVATEGGGTNEIIVDGVTGFSVRPYDAVQLASRLLELLSSPEKRKSFGQSGYRRIQESFSIDKMCSEFYMLYKQLI